MDGNTRTHGTKSCPPWFYKADLGVKNLYFISLIAVSDIRNTKQGPLRVGTRSVRINGAWSLFRTGTLARKVCACTYNQWAKYRLDTDKTGWLLINSVLQLCSYETLWTVHEKLCGLYCLLAVFLRGTTNFCARCRRPNKGHDCRLRQESSVWKPTHTCCCIVVIV